MGHLRDKMETDLKLAGRSESTRKVYLGCARRFVKFYMRSPEDLGLPEVRKFLLFLVEERKVAEGTLRVQLAALKFLY